MKTATSLKQRRGMALAMSRPGAGTNGRKRRPSNSKEHIRLMQFNGLHDADPRPRPDYMDRERRLRPGESADRLRQRNEQLYRDMPYATNGKPIVARLMQVVGDRVFAIRKQITLDPRQAAYGAVLLAQMVRANLCPEHAPSVYLEILHTA